jgi:hypothetical protein
MHRTPRQSSIPWWPGLALFACLGLAPFGPAAAQSLDGELILASTGHNAGVFHTSSRSLGLTSIAGTSTLWVPAVVPAYRNDGVMILTTVGSGALLRIRETGLPQRVVGFPGPAPRDLVLDQDGSWLATATNAIFRLSGSQLTTWATGPGGWDAITRDGDTGDFVLTDVPGGRLVRVDRVTRKFTTIASNLGANVLTGVAYNPTDGRLGVTRLNSRTGLVIVGSRTSARTYVSITNAGTVAVHPWTGRYLVATHDGRVYSVAPDGTIVSSRAFGAGYAFRDVAVWGSRNLSLFGSGGRGTTTTIALRFPQSPARTYCVAASFGNRPGLALPDGRRLMFAPDPLFFITVCRDIPGLTEGFVGTLGRSGTATAKLSIPAFVPDGTRLYLVAAAVNPSLPGALDVSNVEVLKVHTVRSP